MEAKLGKYAGLTARGLHEKLERIRKGEEEGFGAAQSFSFADLARIDQVSPAKVLHDLGLNLEKMNVSMLLDSVHHDDRYIVPEFFYEFMYRGFKARPWYTRWCAGEENVSPDIIKMPHFNITDSAGPADTHQGADIEEATVSWGDRAVNIRKLARKMGFTYEQIKWMKLSMLQLFLNIWGLKFGQKMNARLIDRLVNGDSADFDMSASVIGVDSPKPDGDGRSYSDLSRVCVRLNALGYSPRRMAGSQTEIHKIVNMSEFKDRVVSNNTLIQIDQDDNPIPANLGLNSHGGVGASKIIVADPTVCMVQLTAIPFALETERIITKQIEIAVASIYSDFGCLQRDAKVVIDETVAFSETDGAVGGFPTYMTAEG